MKKGYIMIFLTIWIIVVIFFILFGISKVIYFINIEDDISISEKDDNVDNSIQIITTSAKEKDEKEEDITYLIKEKNGYIDIYILDENGNEFFKERTQIITKYLPEIDQNKLKDGIKVIGKEELNRVIEDFE